MAFLDCESRGPSNPSGWKRANFAHFSNVTVLQITTVRMTEKFVLDLSGLIHLKSLEITGRDLQRLVLQGLPDTLTYLCLISVPNHLDESDSSQNFIIQSWRLKEQWESTRNSRQLMKRIGCLERLHFLFLIGFEGAELPNMSSMSSMRCALFFDFKNAVTVTGISSKLATHFRNLYFVGLQELRSCLGVGDLAVLEELSITECRKLKMLPNLRKLSKLRILDIRQCPLIIEVPGLDELIALEELYARFGKDSTSEEATCNLRLPNVAKLSKLRVLSLPGCRLWAVQGLDYLSSTQNLEADFRDLENIPSLRRLTKLQTLVFDGWSSEGLTELDKLTMLHTLDIGCICGVNEVPDLRSLICLRALLIRDSDFKNVSGLSTLGAFEALFTRDFSSLEIIRGLYKLTRLKRLYIINCPIEDRTFIGNQLPGLRILMLVDCESLTTLSDLHAFPGLVKLELRKCSRLRRLHCSGRLKALQLLDLGKCTCLNALPDLGMFPALEDLVLEGCDGLTILRSTARHLPALRVLRARQCKNLKWNDLRRFRLLHCRQLMIDHEFLV